MANQPDINKRQILLRIPHEIYYRLLKLAGGDRSRVVVVIRQIIAAHVEDVVLTSDDFEQIAADIRANAAKREKML